MQQDKKIPKVGVSVCIVMWKDRVLCNTERVALRMVSTTRYLLLNKIVNYSKINAIKANLGIVMTGLPVCLSRTKKKKKILFGQENWTMM
jgi:hypothetical protein